MPVQLDTFRNIAAEGGTQQVLLAGAGQGEELKTRGSFASWAVNLFRGEGVRQEQRAVAQAFVQALQGQLNEAVGQGTNLPSALKTDYSAALDDAMASIRSKLANQLDGTKALTADDIQQALSFIAEIQQETLGALTLEANEAAVLEQAVMGQAGQRLTDLQSLTAGLRGTSAEAATPGQSLVHYLGGGKTDADGMANITDQVDALKSALDRASSALADLNALPAGASSRPEVQDMKRDLETALQDGPVVEALKWFNESHRHQQLAQSRVDTTAVPRPNGTGIHNERTPRALLEAFQKGEKLTPADLEFLDVWANQSPGLINTSARLVSMTSGEKDMVRMQNVLSQISEAQYGSLAEGEFAIDADLLDGQGGVTETPFRDEATTALWARRDDMVATLQDISLLKTQARAALAAQGDITQLPKGYVDPFREAPQGDANPHHEPNPQAEPGASALSARRTAGAVLQETAEYHTPEAGSGADQPRNFGLTDDQKASRRERVAALNAALGLSANGKTHLEGVEPGQRHDQKEVRIDAQAAPGRSIPQEGKNTARGYDKEVDSGHQEAAQALGLRNYLPDSPAGFEALARSIGVDPASLSGPQKDLYRAALTDSVRYRLQFEPGRGEFTADDLKQKAVEHLRYAAEMTSAQAVERLEVWSNIRNLGAQLARGLSGSAADAKGLGVVVSSLVKEAGELAPEIFAKLDFDRGSMGGDDLRQMRQRAAMAIAEGMSTSVAERVVDAFNQPDSMARATLLMLGANAGAHSSVTEPAASLNAAETQDVVIRVMTAIGKRAGQDNMSEMVSATVDIGAGMEVRDARALLNNTAGNRAAAAALSEVGVQDKAVLAQARAVVTEAFQLRVPVWQDWERQMAASGNI